MLFFPPCGGFAFSCSTHFCVASLRSFASSSRVFLPRRARAARARRSGLDRTWSHALDLDTAARSLGNLATRSGPRHYHSNPVEPGHTLWTLTSLPEAWGTRSHATTRSWTLWTLTSPPEGWGWSHGLNLDITTRSLGNLVTRRGARHHHLVSKYASF